jgi:hypothetical protein
MLTLVFSINSENSISKFIKKAILSGQEVSDAIPKNNCFYAMADSSGFKP